MDVPHYSNWTSWISFHLLTSIQKHVWNKPLVETDWEKWPLKIVRKWENSPKTRVHRFSQYAYTVVYRITWCIMTVYHDVLVDNTVFLLRKLQIPLRFSFFFFWECGYGGMSGSCSIKPVSHYTLYGLVLGLMWRMSVWAPAQGETDRWGGGVGWGWGEGWSWVEKGADMLALFTNSKRHQRDDERSQKYKKCSNDRHLKS